MRKKKPQVIQQVAHDEQKMFTAIVESSDDAIVSKTLQGIITSWNRAAERMFGWSAEEIIGKPILTLIPPHLHKEEKKIIAQLKRGKRIHHYETTRVRKDGKYISVSLSISPIKDDKGKIIGAAKIARDITAQKNQERDQKFLKEASKILGATIDYKTTLKNIAKLIIPSLADYCRIVVLNENNQIQEIAVHHKDPKKLHLVKRLYLLYTQNSANTQGVKSLLIKGQSELMERMTPQIEASIKNNPELLAVIKELKLVSYMGVPLKIGNRIIGALTFSSTTPEHIYTKTDVLLAEELARRAAFAVENAKLYDEAQKAIVIRDNFISVASHELKTPVTSLKMYTQGLQLQFVRKKQEVPLPLLRMDNQINKLTLLISDLLNVSRVQLGKLEFQKGVVDLNTLVKEAVENMQVSSPKHKIIIQGTIKKKIWGDNDRLGQVVTNLLSNAIKYSPQADEVVVELINEKHGAIVAVKDFGIGIEQRYLNKIFNRFYRVSDPNEKTFPGLGIGLYISNEIIKHHNGKMNVESKKGGGSRFSFTLPYYEKND
jgi:PAS domain S-box-containing protein